MELRRIALLALAACVPQTKRLVVPDAMMKMNTGPTVAASRAASAGAAGAAGSGAGTDASQVTDLYAVPIAPGAKASPAVALAKKPVVAPPLRAPSTSATPRDQRYVLRLVEHGRVWEVELPEETGGYEVRIPLGSPIEAPTAADQELLGKDPKGAPAKSYLGALAKIAEMYASHRYELALIEAVDLGQLYPKDGRIEAMKGSLYQRLGKTELARESWKKSLELDPSDVTVAEALRGLKGE
jgi:hypothetical protein